MRVSPEDAALLEATRSRPSGVVRARPPLHATPAAAAALRARWIGPRGIAIASLTSRSSVPRVALATPDGVGPLDAPDLVTWLVSVTHPTLTCLEIDHPGLNGEIVAAAPLVTPAAHHGALLVVVASAGDAALRDLASLACEVAVDLEIADRRAQRAALAARRNPALA